MKRLKTFAKNVGFLTLAEIIVKIVLFFWTIFLARALGTTIFGQYNFINSFIVLFSVLPDLGVSLVLIREISQNKKRAPRYLGNTLILNFCLSLLVFFLVLIMANFLDYSFPVKLVLLLAALTLGVTSLRTTAMVLFNAFERMDLVAFFNCFNTLFLVGFGFLGLFLEGGILGVFSGILIGTIISGFIVWSIVFKKFVVPKAHFDFSLVHHLIAEGWPLGLAGFFALVYTRIDRLILSSMLDYQAVGWYSAASVFPSSAIQLFNVPLMIVAFPLLSRLFLKNKQLFLKTIRNLCLIVLVWSLPLAALTTIFAKQIVFLFYGVSYHNSISILQVVVWYIIFASLSAVFYRILIVIKKQKLYLLISFLGALLNICLNLFLIPKFGYLGAAWAMVVTQIIICGLYVSVVLQQLSS